MRPDQIWSAVQEELRFQLAKPSYETWLKNTSLLSREPQPPRARPRETGAAAQVSGLDRKRWLSC